MNFRFDIFLFVPVVFLFFAGLITTYPWGSSLSEGLFMKQLIISIIGVIIFLAASQFNYSFLRGPLVSPLLYIISIFFLLFLVFFAVEINGAKSWIFIGPLTVQPVEFLKLVMVIVFSQYFALRHIYIKHVQHILLSLFILAIPFFMVFAQPDLGSATVLIGIWCGIIFVSEISKKHIVALFILAIGLLFAGYSLLSPTQQARITSFIEPLENLDTFGYNAYQAKIAIGSGEIIGKGVGDGTQANLQFLPLYESDFIFSAFAEEWGFVGVLIIITLLIIIILRLLNYAVHGRTNFETLFAVGVASWFMLNIFLHIGANVGLLPITGITLPFMSYGGSHIIAEMLALGILVGMNHSKRSITLEEEVAIRK